MRLTSIGRLIAATALVAAPVAASAAQSTANPAASLSIAKSVRASAPAGKKSALLGGGVFGLVILAGIVAIGVIAIVNDSDSDSN